MALSRVLGSAVEQQDFPDWPAAGDLVSTAARTPLASTIADLRSSLAGITAVTSFPALPHKIAALSGVSDGNFHPTTFLGVALELH